MRQVGSWSVSSLLIYVFMCVSALSTLLDLGPYVFPLTLFQIFSSRAPARQFGMRLKDLRGFTADLGLATRVVFDALFDDILLPAPSVLASAVTMPEFRVSQIQQYLIQATTVREVG